MECYIIYGYSGMFDSAETWNVCVKKDKASAEELVKKLTEDLTRFNIVNDFSAYLDHRQVKCSTDSHLRNLLTYDKKANYTGYGIEYGIEETTIT